MSRLIAHMVFMGMIDQGEVEEFIEKQGWDKEKTMLAHIALGKLIVEHEMSKDLFELKKSGFESGLTRAATVHSLRQFKTEEEIVTLLKKLFTEVGEEGDSSRNKKMNVRLTDLPPIHNN